MDKDEAIAWLNGERSMANLVPQDPFETWQVRIAQADAAMMLQAYLILRARKEGLTTADYDDLGNYLWA